MPGITEQVLCKMLFRVTAVPAPTVHFRAIISPACGYSTATMSENRSQSIKIEVHELLVKPPKDLEEQRLSIIGSAKLTRQGSMVASNYDQVSKGDMVRRYREQSNTPRKDSAPVLVQTESVKVEPPRVESYQIEVPKSGLFNRGEYFTPLYLPTGCETKPTQKLAEGSELESPPKKSAESTTPGAPIRNMVYCSDEATWAEYQEEHGLNTGARTHYGLRFDSNFECGNLLKAESVQRRGAPMDAPEEYDLTIRPDPAQHNKLDTSSTKPTTCAQWYFFRVLDTKKRSYRFNIGPFSHRIPALEQGMKPVMISEAAYKTRGTGWRRVGDDVSFSEVQKEVQRGAAKAPVSYMLSFHITFETAKDIVYFAFTPPYTYTQLQNMLYTLTKDPIASKDLHVRPLCRTLAGNRCDLVTISENVGLNQKNADFSLGSTKNRGSMSTKGGFGSSDFQEYDEEVPDFLLKIQNKMDTHRRAEEAKRADQNRKKVIFITARMHGCETVSSWMCEGVIKFLLSLHPTAVALKKVFVFYIVPMVNPDGVVNGYAKSDILGTDLNQHWESPSSALHPTVFHLKALMRRFEENNGIHAFFDLHGQAAKEGLFFHSVLSPTTNAEKEEETRGAEAIAPGIQVPAPLEKRDPRNFTLAAARRCPLVNLKQCSLQLNKRKSGSARAVAAAEFGVLLSIAVEASFFNSPAHKLKEPRQLVSADYARFGCVIMLALADINRIGPPPTSRILPTEKVTRVRRASMKAAGLQASIVHSAAAAASAVGAALSASPFTPAGMRPINTFSSDPYDAVPRESVVYTAIRAPPGAKRDSFLIGASVRVTNQESTLYRSRTNTEVEIEPFDATEAGGFAHTDEHVHFFAGEDIDPSDFDDPDLQLHYDEDKWETVSDSSDGDILLPAEPGPPPVNDEGVINLTDNMLFNLRRYDELDLGIARVNPIALSMSMKASQKVTFGGASSKFPHITPTAAANVARKGDLLPQIGSAGTPAIAGASHPQGQLQIQSGAGGVASVVGAIVVDTTVPGPPLGSPPQGSAPGTAPGSAPFTPSRPATHSPGRNATARSLRKAMMSPEKAHAGAEQVSDPMELSVMPVSAGQAPSTAERGHTRERGERGDRGDVVALRNDRLGPDVEVTRISTAEHSKPLTPHTSKKGTVKLNFTRDAATTGAQGGIQGKSIGEPKGQVSFTVRANTADSYVDFDLDGFESLQTAVSEHVEVMGNTNTATTPGRRLSSKERAVSAKTNLRVVTVPTAPQPNGVESTPSSPPKSIHGENQHFSFPMTDTDSFAGQTGTMEVALFSTEEASMVNLTNPNDAEVTEALAAALLEAVDVVTGEQQGMLVNTDERLLLGISADGDSPISPFSIPLSVPVQGIDPLNNSMSPLFALYTSGAALYSERVAEIIEEQERARTAERTGTANASRPVTTHASRTTTPALNTHTRTSDRGRPQTPPTSAEGSLTADPTASALNRSITSLPYVRLAPNMFTHTQSQASTSIVFDDSLAEESTLQLPGSAYYRAAPAKIEAPVDFHASKLAPSSYKHDHERVCTTVTDKPRTTQEKLQAQFLHEMGLEYKQIFGAKGVLSPHKKRPSSKHPSQLEAPLISNQLSAQEGPVGTFSTAFPLRRAMYEKEVVQLRGANDETMPVLVREGHKGVGGIRPIEKERVYLRHQLDQYYQHIETSLRERQLVEEGQTQITARRIYDLVHQVSLLDAEEISRMKLQDTIRRRWLSRGGNWRGKHKFRNNKSLTDGSSVQTAKSDAPESRQTYRQVRAVLNSHGSAEGSILQGYNELIMGSEEDPGNGWQWLTGGGVGGPGGINIPTATITEEDYRGETAGTEIGELNEHHNTEASQEEHQEQEHGQCSTEHPSAHQEGLEFNPLLPSEALVEQIGALDINTDSPAMTTSTKHKLNKEKRVPSVALAGKSLQFDIQTTVGRVLHSGGIADVDHSSYVHSQLQEELQRSVLEATAEQTAQETVRSKSRQQPTSAHNAAMRNLTSPPQARLSLFGADMKRNQSPQARKTKSPAVNQLPLPTELPPVNDVGRDADTPGKRQLALTLASAPVDTDRAGSAVPTSERAAETEDHFPEHAADSFPHTDEALVAAASRNATAQDSAELLRMDSEYANYLRYGDIYTKSILAGVDTEQLSLHGSGLALPSASTHRETEPSNIRYNPLIAKRLYAVSSTHQGHINGSQLEETSGEIVLRNLRKAIPTQQLKLEATAPRVLLNPADKVLTPRRPAAERPSPKAVVTFVAPPVQDDVPVTPNLVVTASRPEGAVLVTPVSPTRAALRQKSPRTATSPSKE